MWQQNSQQIGNSKKSKKVYLDYQLVSPSYENPELFKSPQIYSARNQNRFKHIVQNSGSNISQHYSVSLNNSVERGRNKNEHKFQDVSGYETNKLRQAIFSANNEQGMLIDNNILDIYKKRKKSIPTIESTSQYQIEQALKYYSSAQYRDTGQQNSFRSPSLRQSRIIGNPYIPLQVDSTKNADLNYSYNFNGNNYQNKNLNYSTLESKVDDSLELTKRQQAMRLVAGNKTGNNTRNASPNKFQAYDGQASDYKIQNQYMGIHQGREKRNKSISVYSAQDLGMNSYGQSSTASLAIDLSQNINQIQSQKRLNKYNSKQTVASLASSPKNKSTEKNVKPSYRNSNLTLQPIQLTKKQKDQQLDLIINSSQNSSPSPSPNAKMKMIKNNSLEMDQDMLGSQKSLIENGSMIKIKKQKQHALTLPKIKFIILELVNNYQDIDQKYVKIDMEKYWLCLLNKSVKLIADTELIQRIQPYLIEIIQSDYYLKFRTNQLSGKYQLKEISKWNFLKEIQSYEKGEIAQNKFYELIIYYFIPSLDYREQLLRDLCLAVNQKVQKAFPFSDDVDTLMDVNGNIISDLYSFNISQKMILAGNLSTLKTLYPSFQNHLQAYNQNLEKITFINQRKKNFQQAFVVQEESQLLNNNSLSNSPQPHKQQLKLPYILKLPPKLSTQDSVCSLTTPQNKHELYTSNQKSTQKKLETRNLSITEIPELKYNNSQDGKQRLDDQQSSQVNLQSQRKIIVKKEQKNSLYLTKGDIEVILKKYEKLIEKDILNFHAEFKQLVGLNHIFEEKANIGINIRLKKPFRDYLLYTQIFFSLNPSFSDKERQFQVQILEALQIEINVGDHQQSTLCWNDFLLIKTCVANKLSHEQKILFLQRFFNKYNLQQISKQEFFNLIASARGTTFNENTEKIILNGFQEEIWRSINELSYIENDNLKIQEFFQKSDPNCRIINDLIQWMIGSAEY